MAALRDYMTLDHKSYVSLSDSQKKDDLSLPIDLRLSNFLN